MRVGGSERLALPAKASGHFPGQRYAIVAGLRSLPERGNSRGRVSGPRSPSALTNAASWSPRATAVSQSFKVLRLVSICAAR